MKVTWDLGEAESQDQFIHFYIPLSQLRSLGGLHKPGVAKCFPPYVVDHSQHSQQPGMMEAVVPNIMFDHP